MKTVYIADDGTEFDNELECREYEKKTSKLMYELKHGVFAYNHKGRYIDFSEYDMENLEYAFEQISYIKFDTQSALDAFMETANDIGCPYFENGINKDLVVSERYFYDDHQDKWFCLEDKQRKLDEIANVFCDK